jgi:hypothetical protein
MEQMDLIVTGTLPRSHTKSLQFKHQSSQIAFIPKYSIIADHETLGRLLPTYRHAVHVCGAQLTSYSRRVSLVLRGLHELFQRT